MTSELTVGDTMRRDSVKPVIPVMPEVPASGGSGREGAVRGVEVDVEKQIERQDTTERNSERS
jgi:hypothetical protein